MSDHYEEVTVYDDEGNEEYSYVERVPDLGPDPDYPPDDYYDEPAPASPPARRPLGWGPVTGSLEPPF